MQSEHKEIFSGATDSFDSIEHLAIAIAGAAVTHEEGMRHLGLLVRPEGQALRLIHQGWHGPRHFHCVDPDPSYCWISLDYLEPFLQQGLADWVYYVWKNNPNGLPYSIAYSDKPYFGVEGSLLPLTIGEGLTCATFALACFEGYQLPLVDRSSWQSRPEDEPWQREILRRLKEYATAQEQAAAQEHEVGLTVRYRPEEVAAAGRLFDATPVPFHVAVWGSYRILDAMKQAGHI